MGLEPRPCRPSQKSAVDRRLWAAEGESDYCFRPHTHTIAGLELDTGKYCLPMDEWMSQYNFRDLTVHIGF